MDRPENERCKSVTHGQTRNKVINNAFPGHFRLRQNSPQNVMQQSDAHNFNFLEKVKLKINKQIEKNILVNQSRQHIQANLDKNDFNSLKQSLKHRFSPRHQRLIESQCDDGEKLMCKSPVEIKKGSSKLGKRIIKRVETLDKDNDDLLQSQRGK